MSEPEKGVLDAFGRVIPVDTNTLYIRHVGLEPIEEFLTGHMWSELKEPYGETGIVHVETGEYLTTHPEIAKTFYPIKSDVNVDRLLELICLLDMAEQGPSIGNTGFFVKSYASVKGVGMKVVYSALTPTYFIVEECLFDDESK